MRTIKFRGKPRASLNIGNQWWYVTPDDEDWDQFWSLVDPETVGQFTGWHDKHGKEGYEGDIVNGNNPWDNHEDALQVVRYEDGTWNYSYAIHEYAEKPERSWEIIGNIYENSELIERS
jgi:uncharacterized phage protein (TIGR01671 family)